MNKYFIVLLIWIASLAVVGAGAAWRMHSHDQIAYDKLVASTSEFKGGVAALGHDAEARNAKQALADLKLKERIDEQNRLDHADAVSTIDRLRRDADRTRRSVVPAAPAGASHPELACFDRAELERANGEALGRLREGARRLADEGTAATLDLDAAKRWTAQLKLSTTLKE